MADYDVISDELAILMAWTKLRGEGRKYLGSVFVRLAEHAFCFLFVQSLSLILSISCIFCTSHLCQGCLWNTKCKESKHYIEIRIVFISAKSKNKSLNMVTFCVQIVKTHQSQLWTKWHLLGRLSGLSSTASMKTYRRKNWSCLPVLITGRMWFTKAQRLTLSSNQSLSDH